MTRIIGKGMPQNFDKWFDCTPDTQIALRERVRKYCNEGPAKAEDSLGGELGIPSLRRWIAGEARYDTLRPEQYLRVVMHGLTRGWLEIDDDGLYRNFCAFLDQRPQHLPGISDSAVKRKQPNVLHYRFYRFSFLARGLVMRGNLTLTQNPDSLAVTTDEVSAIPEGTPGRNDYDPAGIVFRRTGRLFPRGGNAYFIIARKDGEEREIQTAYLTHVGSYHLLHGRLSDWHGDNYYTTRLVAQWIREPLKSNEIGCIKPEELDPGVRDYLTGEIDIAKWVASLKN